jgi:uncharacterized protein (DUF427 family)
MKYDLPNKSIHKFYGFLCLDEMQKTVKYSWRKCEWKGNASGKEMRVERKCEWKGNASGKEMEVGQQ